MFQFLKGTIKALQQVKIQQLTLWFQFLKGTIKATKIALFDKIKKSFNS